MAKTTTTTSELVKDLETTIGVIVNGKPKKAAGKGKPSSKPKTPKEETTETPKEEIVDSRARDLVEIGKLEAEVDELVLQYNDNAYNGKIDDLKAILDKCKQCNNKITAIRKRNCFEDLEKAEDPMIAAVLKLRFDCYKIGETKDKETGIPSIKRLDNQQKINLFEFGDHAKVAKVTVGHDRHWSSLIEKVAFLLTQWVQEEINSTKADKERLTRDYKMSPIVRSLIVDDDIKEGSQLTSNSNQMKLVTKAVAALVGEEYKPLSHDVAFLRHCCSKAGKRDGSVAMARPESIAYTLMLICKRIINNEYGYSVESSMLSDKN